jgi:hypothetical protein
MVKLVRCCVKIDLLDLFEVVIVVVCRGHVLSLSSWASIA